MSDTYMVISPQEFIHSIKPIIDQKRARGMNVVIKHVEDFGAPPDHSAMRAFILGAQPTYLLLVGDHDRTPSYRYQNSFDSDNCFAMEDSDIFPRVHIGRLSSNDTNILNTISRAIVDYPADPSPNWKRRVILTGWCPRASRDSNGDAGWQCLDEIGSYYDVVKEFQNAGTPEQRAVWETEYNTRSTLIQAINQGASIVRYFGHGQWNFWGNVGNNEDFRDTHVGLLQVDNQLPFVISATCLTGDIQRNSLAESFQVQRKAIGVFAADVESDTWWNERFVSRVFREIVTKRNRRVADIILGARKQVYEDFATPPGGRDPTSAKQSRIYRYLGDPDTILAVPEDDGLNDCRQVWFNLRHSANGVVTNQVTIDFGKNVRRCWGVIGGLDSSSRIASGQFPFRVLKVETTASGTKVTVTLKTSFFTSAVPSSGRRPSRPPASKVLVTVFAVL